MFIRCKSVSIFSLEIFLLLSVYLFSSVVLADAFENKLNEISQIPDKHTALTEIIELLSSEQLSHRQRSSALLTKSKMHLSLSDLSTALNVAEKSKNLAEKHSAKKEAADAYKMIGVYQYYMGNNQDAITAYESALIFYDVQSTPIPHANLLNNLGLAYAAMQQISTAIRQYEAAEPIYAEHGTEQDLIDIRHNIGGLYLRIERYDAAIQAFHEVIKRSEKIGSTDGFGRVYSDLGASYRHAKQFDQSKRYLLAALEYSSSNNNDYDVASHLHNLAELHNDLKDFNKSIEYANSAIKLAKKHNHQNALSGGLHSLAIAQYSLGDINNALVSIESSDAIAKTINFESQIQDNKVASALINAAKGNSVEALSKIRNYEMTVKREFNDRLNGELSSFESKQLKQQVADLKQKDIVSQLENNKAKQQRNFIVIVVVLVLLSFFFIYLRNSERMKKQELEIKVKARTRELEAALSQLTAANAVKSQFLANMSHEIRTPLTAVIGQAEAIVSGDVTDDYVMEEVSVIRENSVYLLALINDILDLSKVEANKLDIDIKPHSLRQLVYELEQMFFERTTSKGLAFEIDFQPADECVVEIDQFRVKQILINLLSNAVKFTLKGKVSLCIKFVNARLVFEVIDTGIGLDEQQKQNIFENFTQSDNSIARKFGGTGLGLALSDKLAKAMQGEIDVQSAVDEGSCFKLTVSCKSSMPYVEEGEQSSRTFVPQPVVSAGDAIRGKLAHFKGTILLAEDHVDNRRLVTRLLERLGLTVLVAENGQEAIELARVYGPQLILMDIQMPAVDGIEAFNKLREVGIDTPIFAFTANAMTHEVQSYLDMGFTGHLNKPVERAILIDTLSKYFVQTNKAELAKEQANTDGTNINSSHGEESSASQLEKNSDQEATIDDDLKESFLKSLLQESQLITLSLERQDLNLLSNHVHRLAGAAMMFGYKDLAELAGSIERCLKQKRVIEAQRDTAILLDELQQLIDNVS